ncbi:MAG: 2-amino-4-hydroxy-6-hydroxymethyldihydropteridine diphosphokinase [Muribaculaceae bacterium]|nr:2-amino-4-hydroxy-6-hydroxymethyldihydropteridine diphosphokinase [Muribaculaceae bacterium]
MTTAKSVPVVFSIGSNCGDRLSNVQIGINWLSSILNDFESSHIYATPDCHGGYREYMNAVVKGITNLTPEHIEKQCKEFEIANGRDCKARAAGDVPLDIDLVIYEDVILRPKDFSREFFKIGYSSI